MERSYLLVNTLLEGISQKPPVLIDFHETLDLIAQVQIFMIQTLLGQERERDEEVRWTNGCTPPNLLTEINKAVSIYPTRNS